MTHESLASHDWDSIVARLGGAPGLEVSARETKAFLRPREIKTAVDLLRMVLAYCLGDKGLRSTAAWATAIGLVDISNVGLLYRLRQCGPWLSLLIGQVLVARAPVPASGRLIRIIDGTTVPKAGGAGSHNKLWRVHSAFDLPSERFGVFELTDESEGERLDRIPVVKGEIRIADRAYMQPERMAAVLEQGADIIIRAGWKSARWLDAADGTSLDLVAALRKAGPDGRIDCRIGIAPKAGSALQLRLVAIKKPPEAAAAARAKASREAQRGGHKLSPATLVAADWVILITSLAADAFSADDILALYRLRWRIELAFKRLKSVVGLKGPPGTDERSAKPFVLAHLLVILLLEPLVDAFEASPRSDQLAA
jgi:Transposase DDE domain